MEEFINMVNKHSWSSSELASHKMNQAFQESGSSLQSVPTFRRYSNNLTVHRRIFPRRVINVDPDARIAELQRSFLVQVGLTGRFQQNKPEIKNIWVNLSVYFWWKTSRFVRFSHIYRNFRAPYRARVICYLTKIRSGIGFLNIFEFQVR